MIWKQEQLNGGLAGLVALWVSASAALAQSVPAALPNLQLSTAGNVRAIGVQPDGKVIIAGTFFTVNDVACTNIVRLNPNGSVDRTWKPRLTGAVNAIAVDGTNIYLAGGALLVEDVNYRAVYRVRMEDGSLDMDWRNGAYTPFATVNAICVAGTNLYAAGYFDTFDGLARTNLVKLSIPGNGAVDPDWAPNANDLVFSLVVSGSNVFAGGYFTRIGGLGRTNVAKLSATGSGAADAAWDAQLKPSLFRGNMAGLALSGTNVYVSGSFTNAGGLPRKGLAKISIANPAVVDTGWNPPEVISTDSILLAAATNGLFARVIGPGFIPTTMKLDLNGVGSQDTNWTASVDIGAAVSAMNVTAGHLLLGGFFHSCNDKVSLGLAKVDLIGGASDPEFNAQIQSPGTVNALLRQDDGKLVVGGDFWLANGLRRQSLVRLGADGLLDTQWAPNPNGIVYALAAGGTNLFVGGGFTKIGGLDRTCLAKFNTQSTDAADPSWNANVDRIVRALVVSDTNVFVGGAFSVIGGQTRHCLAKLDVGSPGNCDAQWLAQTEDFGRQIYTLTLDGTNLFVGGFFDSINGVARTNLAKVSALGAGNVDTNWNASVNRRSGYQDLVSGLVADGTNLFVGGGFATIADAPRAGLAKVSVAGNGLADTQWNPLNTNSASVTTLALDGTGTNLFVGGSYYDGVTPYRNLIRVSTVNTGAVDPTFNPLPNHGAVTALLAKGRGVYVGGDFAQAGQYGNSSLIAGEDRYALAFLPAVGPPTLTLDLDGSLFIDRNQDDGDEVTHFYITSITGVALFLNDGVTPVHTNDFLPVAQGRAGLKVIGTNGSVTAVSSVNSRLSGLGSFPNTINIAPPPPTFVLAAPAFSLKEGGALNAAVRKYGAGAGNVNYTTANGSALAGVDYQPRSGTIYFGPTETVKYLPVIATANDFHFSGDRSFYVLLTGSSGDTMVGNPAKATITILDDDGVAASDSVLTNAPPAAPPGTTGTTLKISLSPTNATGQWRLIGDLNWHDDGSQVSGLVKGNYTVEFRPVTGYRQPETQVVPILAGQTNAFTFFYAATTTPDTGNLTATIAPDDVATNLNPSLRGQWRRQGESGWHNSGEVAAGLPPGSYTVEFKPVAGRSTPFPQLLQIGGGGADYGNTAIYLVAPPTTGALTPQPVPFDMATTNPPYLYNGQLQTSIGFASGVVVKPRVVLTVAHALFDDVQLRYASTTRWFFQRYRDRLEPLPQIPRGCYVFDGYASQRALDNSPGISTPASQNLDAAALYFLEAAGRGGYGGFISSDADSNEYLTSPNSQFLAGYPLDGVAPADQGRLFATAPTNGAFTKVYNQVYATTQLASYPGNSGGPLYVQNSDGRYYPAGIYLGGAGETLVRAIDSQVVDLINRAEISGNGGGNSTGGGVSTLNPGVTTTTFGSGLLTVNLTPSGDSGFRSGWRIAGNADTNYLAATSTTLSLIGGGGYPIEFKAIPGFLTPSNRVVQIINNQTTTLQIDYTPIRLVINFSQRTNLTFTSGTGATYRVEFATNLLTSNTLWIPFITQTLSSASTTVTNLGPATNKARYYRVRLLP